MFLGKFIWMKSGLNLSPILKLLNIKMMKTLIKKWSFVLLGVLVGYPLMGLLITIVQEWFFKGVGYYESSLAELVVAGTGTFLSAVAGGWVAFAINSFQSKISNYLMSLLVVAETTWLFSSGKAGGPLWFDVLAASSLIVGILLGCNLDLFRKKVVVNPS